MQIEWQLCCEYYISPRAILTPSWPPTFLSVKGTAFSRAVTRIYPCAALAAGVGFEKTGTQR
jgi:hypothetical protein